MTSTRTTARRWPTNWGQRTVPVQPTSADVESGGAALVSAAVGRPSAVCDVMVNNAGVSGTMHRRFLDDDLADFNKVMGVNVLGGDGGYPRCRAIHGRTRWWFDHQPHLDRRHSGRRRGDDVSRIQGRGHPVHQVVRRSSWPITRSGSTPSRRATSAPQSWRKSASPEDARAHRRVRGEDPGPDA